LPIVMAPTAFEVDSEVAARIEMTAVNGDIAGAVDGEIGDGIGTDADAAEGDRPGGINNIGAVGPGTAIVVAARDGDRTAAQDIEIVNDVVSNR